MSRRARGLSTTLTLRDENLLLFLWTWKLSTLKTLAYVFFPETSLIVAYHRLCKLRNAGFLRQRIDESGRIRVWTLDRKGFAALANRLPELEEYGFGSENIEHDLFVNALHLGNWARTLPDGVELFTEQQLRRYKMEMYPEWAPKNKNHRPDGYWHLAQGPHQLTMALEVELSAKSASRYEAIAKFYDFYDSVDRVIWLVANTQLSTKILKAASGSNFYRSGIHNFIRLDDFQKTVWNAQIFSGPNQGISIFELLSQSVMQTLVQTVVQTDVTAPQNCMSSHLLDVSVSL